MSIKKKAVALLGCAALAFSLIGCQQGEKKEPEPTDVQLMQDAGDARIDEPFCVLVVGNDSRTGTVEIDKPDYADGSGRSDTTMLVRIDPETYQVGIVTTPRDTAISLNGQTTKFNEAYCVGGIEETLHQVKLPTGISPLYYMDMSFVQFEKFVNELGGLTANVPIDMGLQDIVSGARSRFLRACRTSTARNRLFWHALARYTRLIRMLAARFKIVSWWRPASRRWPLILRVLRRTCRRSCPM